MAKEIETTAEHGEIVIPFDKEQFAGFIRGILGKQQTNTKKIKGTFNLSIDHIDDIIDLIDQRINQQNKSTLLQISMKVVFSDNSTRLLGSRTEIKTFSDPRDVYPISAHLALEYLIQFNDKDRPEKQDIEISFITNDIRSRIFLSEDNAPFVFNRTQGIVFITIKHTAVTWAYDMEALITKKINSLLIKENKFLNFIESNSGKISFIVAALLFLTIISFNVLALIELSQTYNSNLRNANLSTADQKIDYIINLVVNGAWSIQSVFTIIVIVVGLVASILIAVWVETAISFNCPSYLLFNDESKKLVEHNKKSFRNRAISLLGSMLTSFFVGLISKILIAMLIK